MSSATRSDLLKLSSQDSHELLVTTQSQLSDKCALVLRSHGWLLQRNRALAPSPKGGNIRADILAISSTTGRQIAVYPRWQATSGTAEEKLPFQLIKFEIARAAKPDCADAAYFVLEGPGWTWRDFYTSGALYSYLPSGMSSHCMSLESFARLVASGGL